MATKKQSSKGKQFRSDKTDAHTRVATLSGFPNGDRALLESEARTANRATIAAPSNLQATAGEGRVDLTWQDNSFDEDGFKIKRQGPSDSGLLDIATVGPNVTQYSDTTVQPNTSYIYRVRAFNASGGAASNDATITTLPPVAAPTNLQAVAGEGRVELTWMDNSTNEDGFKIKRKGPTDVDFVEAGTVGTNSTTYTDTQIQPNTTYVYRVRAFRNTGGGAASNDATVTTLPLVAAPSNLRAMAGEGKVDLTWIDNSLNEDGFKIKRKGQLDADFVDIATVGPNTITYADTQIQPNTTYTYRVRAFRNAGGGAASNDATVTTLPLVSPPTNLQAIASEGRVDLTWQDNSTNEDGFIVKRKVGTDPNTTFSDVFTTSPNVMTYSDTAVQPNTIYTYKVRAFRNAGGGAASNEATVTTLPLITAPTNLRAVAIDGKVQLTWQDNSTNEDGFKIRRKGPNDIDFTDIGSVGVNVTNYSDSQIQPNTTYAYKVRAYRNTGGGGASNEATVTTLPLIAAPTNLRAVAGAGKVGLTWVDNSTNEDGFIVERKVGTDPNTAFVDRFTTAPNVTTYSDTAVQANTTYTYRIRAFRNSGGGAASNDATVTTPPPVQADTTAPTVSSVTLTPALSSLKTSYQPGEAVTITWVSSDNVGVVAHDVLFLSTGEAASAQPIATNLAGSQQSFNWTIPNQLTNTAAVRIVARDAAGNQDGLRSASFAIQLADESDDANRKPTLTVNTIEPNHGPFSGGTTIRILGRGFANGCKVKFKGNFSGSTIPTTINATTTTFVSDTEVMAVTPEVPSGSPSPLDPVDVKVANPDRQFGLSTKGFTYDSPPVITKLDPPSGPLPDPNTSDPRALQQIFIEGSFFQEGVSVIFGEDDKARNAFVEAVTPNKITLRVPVPAVNEKGLAAVTVRNPDRQQAKLAMMEGFRYLSSTQATRPRINKITPLTILEDTVTPVTLQGFNLKQAFDQRLIVVRGPGTDLAQITITQGNATPNQDRKEDIVTFMLRVTVSVELGLAEQLPLMVAASLRLNAAQDLLLEGNPVMLHVVSKALPVPLGFTAKLIDGGPNLVMMVGRNLQDTKLAIWQGQTRLEFPSQRAEDEVVMGILPLNNALSEPLRLQLMDAGGNPVLKDPLALTTESLVVNATPAQTQSSASGFGSFNLQPVQNRRAVGSFSRGMAAVNVKDGKYLPISKPNRNSPYLKDKAKKPGIGLDIVSTSIDLALFERTLVLPAFSRPQEGQISLTPINVKAGKILSIQALSLLLYVRIDISIDVSVALVPIFDPFLDFEFFDPFNDFTSDLPVPLNTFPGAILFDVATDITVSLSVVFLLGLVKPRNSTRPREELQVLAALNLNASITDQGFEFGVGFALSARLNAVTPLGGGLRGRILHLASSRPVPDEAGFRGFYFASEAGRDCLPWRFNATVVKAFQSGKPEETTDDYEILICIDVVENAGLTDFFIYQDDKRLEPPDHPMLALPNGEQATLIAKDENGNPLPGPDRVNFERDPSTPAIIDVKDQDTSNSALVTALEDGSAKVRAKLSTQGQGFGLRLTPDLTFAVDKFVSTGDLPRAVKTVEVTVPSNGGGTVSKAEVFFLDSQNRRFDQQIDKTKALGISNFVTNRGLPALSVTNFDTKSDDRKNFRLEVEAQDVGADTNSVTTRLFVTESDGKTPLGEPDGKEYKLSYRKGKVFRGPFLRLVTDGIDKDSVPDQTILVKTGSTIMIKYSGKDLNGNEITATNSIQVCKPMNEKFPRRTEKSPKADQGYEFEPDPNVFFTEKPIRVLDLDIRIGFLDKDGDGFRDLDQGEKDAIAREDVEKLIAFANERWASAAIQFRAPSPLNYTFFPYPPGVLDNLGQFKTLPPQISLANTLELSDAMLAVLKKSPPAGGKTVTVYFVPPFNEPTAGLAYPPAKLKLAKDLEIDAMKKVGPSRTPGEKQDQKFSNVFFIGIQSAGQAPSALAHELGHILTNTGDSTQDLASLYPSLAKPQNPNSVSGSRRLLDSQSDPSSMDHPYGTSAMFGVDGRVAQTLVTIQDFDVASVARRRRPINLLIAPTNLTAIAVNREIQLSWTNNSDDLTEPGNILLRGGELDEPVVGGFIIERKSRLQGTGFGPLKQVGLGVTTFIDDTVKAGDIYTYRVKAFNPQGESVPSNEASPTTVAFQLSDGTPLPQPFRVGISTVDDKGNVIRSRARTIRAVVEPASEVNTITLTMDNESDTARGRIMISNVTKSNNSIAFDVVGLNPTKLDPNQPDKSRAGDVSIIARHASGMDIATQKVAVVIPANIQEPRDARSCSATIQGNFARNKTTFPAEPEIEPNMVKLLTAYEHVLVIAVIDQFGDLAGDLYTGAEILEDPLDDAGNPTGMRVRINQRLTSEGTYLDPVGVNYLATDKGNADFPGDVVGKDSPQAKLWVTGKDSKGMNVVISPVAGILRQKRIVYVDDFQLERIERTLTVDAPDLLDISWPGKRQQNLFEGPSMLQAAQRDTDPPIIDLSWTSNAVVTPGGFTVERLSDGQTYEVLGNPRELKFSDQNIQLAQERRTTYTYRVKAFKDYQNPTVRLHSCYSKDLKAIYLPVPGMPVVSLDMSSGKPVLKISWMDTSNGMANGFALYRKIEGSNEFHFLVKTRDTEYPDKDANGGQTYTYRVKVAEDRVSDIFGSAFSDPSTPFKVPSTLAPVIAGMSPSSGPVGTQVTLSGTGFVGVQQVRVATTNVSFTVNPAGTAITFQWPAAVASGAVTVLTPTGTATSPMTFTVVQPTNSVTLSVVPTSRIVQQGQSTSFDVTITRTGSNAAVSFAVGGLPVGAIASFNPPSATGNSSTLTIVTMATTTPGTSNLTISGSAPSLTIAPVSVSLTVVAAPVLNAPSNLMATVIGQQVNLQWQDNSANEEGFRLERRAGQNPYQLLATVGRSITTFADVTVMPGFLYVYRVSAFQGPNQSTPSNEASAMVSPKQKESKETKETKESKEFKELKEREKDLKGEGKEDKEVKENKEKERKEKEKEGFEKDRLKDNKDNREGKGFSLESGFRSLSAVPFSGQSLEERLGEVEQAVKKLQRHFISRESRPDLDTSALKRERNHPSSSAKRTGQEPNE